jgi:hypothetical protein
MSEPTPQILLATPVWKDSSRLAVYGMDLAKALAASPLQIRWVIADDGSGEVERVRLIELRDRLAEIYPNVEVDFADHHYGKGSTVKRAWALAPDADWLAFVDADGSVTAEEMLGLIGKAVAASSSVIGIRKRTETTHIVESPWRGFAHRGYLLTANILLDLACEDLQCGGKVLRGDDYRQVAPYLKEDGFAFDSELLCLLNRDGAGWLEVPISWEEKGGGKVKPLRDAWAMLAALIRIKIRME